MTTSAKSAAVEKKDVQKLQRAIIDGLEDVKGQDIVVFDTEHITSLFERVIIASGTSNRQTKALAASVRDAVRDAGFSKPRTEGEDNGEWIIVDCGAAVAHIMQPTIRQYYHLEELWGDKPIKLKLGAPAPLVKAAKVEVIEEPVAKTKTKAAVSSRAAKFGKAGKAGVKAAAKKSAEKAPVRIPTTTVDPSYVGRVGKTNDWTAKRNATETAVEPAAKVRKPAAKTPIVKIPVAKKAAAKKVVAKKAASSAAVKKAAPKKPAPRGK